MSAASLHISVEDGDITVWVLHDGHAYPFAEANDARWAADQMEAGKPNNWNDADAGYDLCAARDVAWWDTAPPARVEVDR